MANPSHKPAPAQNGQPTSGGESRPYPYAIEIQAALYWASPGFRQQGKLTPHARATLHRYADRAEFVLPASPIAIAAYILERVVSRHEDIITEMDRAITEAEQSDATLPLPLSEEGER